jgi:hypothetical protein
VYVTHGTGVRVGEPLAAPQGANIPGKSVVVGTKFVGIASKHVATPFRDSSGDASDLTNYSGMALA